MGQSLSLQPFPQADMVSALPLELALRGALFVFFVCFVCSTSCCAASMHIQALDGRGIHVLAPYKLVTLVSNQS